MSQKRITYFGTDEELATELEQYSEEYVLGDHEYKSFATKKPKIAEYCLRKIQNIVFIDLTGIDEPEIAKMIGQVQFIKNQPTRKSVLFAVVFENLKQANMYHWICAKGFQISMIKGQDSLSFFMDCYRIAISDDYALPRFAKAQNINKNLKLYCCSSLLALNQKYAFLETDLNGLMDEGQVNMNLPGVLGISSRCKIREHYPVGILGMGLDTYLVEMPLASPWDEITEEMIAPETIQTWIDNHAEELTKINPFIYLINLSCEDNLESAYHLSNTNKLNFVFEGEILDEEKIKNQLKLTRPPLIFIQLEKEPKTEQFDLTPLEIVISCMNNVTDYRPIIVVGSCPSSSEAMRKTFGHSGILSHSAGLSWDTIEQLAVKFKEKRPDQIDIHHLEFLDPKTSTSYAEVDFEVEVSSLTEHEITFYSNEDIPMFSVFRIELPVKTLVTIIPAAYELETSPKGQHYMGIFHGCGEEDLNRLRKFVNQIIYQPLNEFSEEVVEKILSQKAHGQDQDIDQTPTPIENKSQTDKNKPVTETHKRAIINGRTKL